MWKNLPLIVVMVFMSGCGMSGKKVNSDKINRVTNAIIYTTSTCPWCFKAKDLLKEHGIKFKEVDIGSDPIAGEALVVKTGWRSVPQIFVSEKNSYDMQDLHFIGGYSDLNKLLSSK